MRLVRLLVLLACSPSVLFAQLDVIRGRVTNADGAPLGNVQVTATSIPGNVVRSARTDARGSYQIAFPNGTGDYMMGFSLVGYVFRQYQVKRLADEQVLVADARLAPVQLDTVITVAAQQQRVSRNSTTPDVSGTERQLQNNTLPPELQGDLAALAASQPGVLLVPGANGGADGFSVLGLGADQNALTLNGLPFDGAGLPRDAGFTSSLATSPFDPSRGGFSGAQLNVRPTSGGNFTRRGMSLVGTAPQMMWTDQAARSIGTEYTNVSVGGVASGPIRPNKAFYNVSYQFARQLRDNPTLLTTSPLGFRTAGVANDSISRFLDVLQLRGIPSIGGPSHAQRYSDNASLFGSLDFTPPNSQSGSAYHVAFNGSFGRQTPVSGGATQLLAASGDRTNWSGGVQGRHSAYVRMLLSETSFGVTGSGNSGEPYLQLPAGRVRVNSDMGDGTNSVQTLSFGGNPGLDSRSTSTGATFSNSLSWFDEANKHRIKLTTDVRYNAASQFMGSNLLGTWYFNSLEELEAGTPASFSRQLAPRTRNTSQLGASISLGDSWRRSTDLNIQYGIRLDANDMRAAPVFNPDVERIFGRRNDRIPNPIAISPRIGFSYTLGALDQVQAFAGAARAPRSVVRGGIGLFVNNTSVGQLASAIDNTGMPGGVQQIHCVGGAAPQPLWSAYASNRSLVPESCADGTSGTVFSNAAPNVVLFASNYAPQQSLRSNLSWQGAILDARFSANVEATFALNRNQQQSVDINFDPTVRFTLPGEASRPVFVQPGSIVQSTGAIASRDARISQSFQRVSEVRSDLESRTGQLSLRISPIVRNARRLTWNAAYTFTGVREQVPGFTSTAGSPLSLEWATAAQGPHQVSYSLGYNLFDYVRISWSGQFRSGAAFTPGVGGDINGDGYANDRAFIYDPARTSDAALAQQMQQLLATTPASSRRCLERQMGQVAERNSCRAPWSSTASLNFTLDRVRTRMPARAQVDFSLSNPLGAADLMLNGSNRLKGWGQAPFPDQTLFYVRGFDPVAQKYTYEVNQRFGATRPQFMTLRAPVTLTMSVRYDIGPTRERQNLDQMLRQRSTMGDVRGQESMLRSVGTNGITNPLVAILRSQDSLRLTSVQADSIAAMNRRYTYRVDSIWTPAARELAALPTEFQAGLAFAQYQHARNAQIDLLEQIVRAVDGMLTSSQRRKLSPQVSIWLDRRFLAQVRHGTGMYVQGMPLGGGANIPLSFEMMGGMIAR